MNEHVIASEWPASLMWYSHPSKEWKEGLPIGNGKLAGMIVGPPERERLALNHEWLWRGRWRHRTVGERHQHLPRIRKLFFQGKLFEAGTLANDKLGGLGGTSDIHNRIDPYQPAGDLIITATEHAQPSDYVRQLDLDRGLVSVTYEIGGARSTREYLAHSTLPVLAVRLHSTRREKFNLALGRIVDPECRVLGYVEGDRFGIEGLFQEGVRFAVEARVITHGTIAPAPSTDRSAAGAVQVDADEALVLLSIAVDHDDGDPLPLCRAQLDSARTSWPKLLDTHVAAHREMYRRVRLELGDAHDEQPTDARVEAARRGEIDSSLLALYTNFGRYLLISSSRPGGLVMNLQGKWNEELNPPWECDLHQDINIQMHHWPADVYGLPECLEPLWEHIERFIESGRRAARAIYNCRGVWYPIQTDLWGKATPESYGWDIWTGAAAWLAQHLWRRYEYGLDEHFLRTRAYPFMKEVAAFYEDYLVQHPEKPWLVTVPSQSPENYFVGGTQPVSLGICATMDIALMHDLLGHCIRASEILGVDVTLRSTWSDILKRLPPYQVGRHGQLQEWLEDYEESEPGHRHLSHLLPLFPGDEFDVDETPELARAARVSLERRLSHEGGHTGWSRAWTVCCWARLREGDLAHEHLMHLLTDFSTTSLLDLHPPRIFQIDGNTGGAAAVAEMLLQSQRGVLRILPALPTAWPRGKVSGLHAIGGFVVDIEWENGRATRVMVRSTRGGTCHVKSDALSSAEVTTNGKRVSTQKDEARVIAFETERGGVYAIGT